MRNQQNVKVRVNSSFETICPFPVGYVYMSSNSTSPANIYGGTWSEITGGRYFRANETWDTGGSDTISVNQIPAHTHTQGAPYYGDNTGSHTGHTTYWGRYANTTRPNTYNSGGGNRSIQRTKTFGRGTELPKGGDASCVTSKQFKSALRAALRKFVHSPLVTSICQPMAQVQQALTGVRGHLSQILDFCGQAVHGTLQAASQRTNSLRQKCHHTGTLFTQVVHYPMVMLINIGVAMAEQHVLPLLRGILSLTGVNRVYVSLPEAEKLTTTFRHIAPVTLGTAQFSLVGEC